MDITKFELEITSLCSLKCFACAHTEKLKKNIPYHQIKKTFYPEFLKKMNFFSFCGARGDCIYHPEFLEIIQYLKETHPGLSIKIHTNGSIHSKGWWRDLALILNENDSVIFALDGVGDVHSVHRIGSDYEKVIRNAESFNRSGGKSFWQFIVFEHNQHQLEEAKKISLEKGFANFDPIYSRTYSQIYKKPTIDFSHLDKTELYSCKIGDSKKDHKAFCKVDRGSLYLDCNGIVCPCCYMTVIDNRLTNPTSSKHLLEFYKNLKKLSIYHNDIEDIIKLDYFSWICRNRYFLSTCKHFCGF